MQMTTPTPTPSAKERVLAFVRAANPSTMEYSDTFKVLISNLDGLDRVVTVANQATMNQIWNNPKIDEVEILGSDLGLPELLIALHLVSEKNNGIVSTEVTDTGRGSVWNDSGKRIGLFHFDLTKNLHSQSDDFYAALLPLLP